MKINQVIELAEKLGLELVRYSPDGFKLSDDKVTVSLFRTGVYHASIRHDDELIYAEGTGAFEALSALRKKLSDDIDMRKSLERDVAKLESLAASSREPDCGAKRDGKD